MGRKSIRENKNIYQTAREDAGLTRSAASEKIGFMSESVLEKIEYEQAKPDPEEALAMAVAYSRPDLCNYYCSHECRIGQLYVPEVKTSDLSQIVLEMIVSLNAMNKQKERLMEITVDGQITEDEMSDFVSIQRMVSQISMAADALQMWIDRSISDGKVDKELLEKYKNNSTQL